MVADRVMAEQPILEQWELREGTSPKDDGYTWTVEACSDEESETQRFGASRAETTPTPIPAHAPETGGIRGSDSARFLRLGTAPTAGHSCRRQKVVVAALQEMPCMSERTFWPHQTHSWRPSAYSSSRISPANSRRCRMLPDRGAPSHGGHPYPLRREARPERFAPHSLFALSFTLRLDRPGLRRIWPGPKPRRYRTFGRWRDPDSNRGHHDFQSCALPTELSRPGRAMLAIRGGTDGVRRRARHNRVRCRTPSDCSYCATPKSSWDDPGLDDHERPLAPRGRRAVKVLNQHLREQHIAPELVICSTSRRTRETLDGVSRAARSRSSQSCTRPAPRT